MIDAGSVLLGVIVSSFVWMVVTTHYWPKRSKRSDMDIRAEGYDRGREVGYAAGWTEYWKMLETKKRDVV